MFWIIICISFAACVMAGVISGPIFSRMNFRKSFGFKVPRGDAAVFAVQPLIEEKLIELRAAMYAHQTKVSDFYSAMLQLPAGTAEEIAIREARYRQHEQLEREQEKIAQKFYKACDAAYYINLHGLKKAVGDDRVEQVSYSGPLG